MTQVTIPSRPTDGAPPVRVRALHVVYGPPRDLPPEIRLVPGATPVVLGREPGAAGVALDDDEASRRHAELGWDEQTDLWSITDLGSRNGTIVDGARVDRAVLHPGAVVRIGRTQLVFADHLLAPGEALVGEGGALRGRGLAMQRLRGEIAAAAPRDWPVLILGETGSGKELVARELHDRSRRTGAFVAVNCAAIHANLAQSELFGHNAGAFTGATTRSDGLFVAADQGTLFLDEIGELPAEIQPQLLRALALGEVRALGRAETRKVDVRIIAATHRDLGGQIEEGRFRADLHARLAGCTIRVPSLRDRREDVLGLARGFLERIAPGVAISAGAAEALLLHRWPYNVRELEHLVTTLATRAHQGVIRADDLPPEIAAPVLSRRGERGRPVEDGSSPIAPPNEALAAGEVPSPEALRALLERHAGNMQEVAAALGRDRRQIYRWAKRYGIDPDAFRPAARGGDE